MLVVGVFVCGTGSLFSSTVHVGMFVALSSLFSSTVHVGMFVCGTERSVQ